MNSKIIKYLDGQMHSEEALQFEKEAEINPGLKEELIKAKRLKKKLSDYNTVESADNYFNDLVPRIRAEITKKERKKQPVLIYAGTFAAALLLIFFLIDPLYVKHTENEINAELSENIEDFLADDYIEYELYNSDILEETADTLLIKELEVQDAANDYSFAATDAEGLLDGINAEEAEIIYNELINRHY